MDRLYQVRSVIQERQEEDRELHIALEQRKTRAILAALGVEQPDKFDLVPGRRDPSEDLPDMDTVMGMFGGPGGGAEFSADEIPGLADYFNKGA